MPANRDRSQFCRNTSLAKLEAHKQLLAKESTNTGIFSHMIQPQTTPGDVYRSDPFPPQSRRRFQELNESH